jgi:hypothetical protein
MDGAIVIHSQQRADAKHHVAGKLIRRVGELFQFLLRELRFDLEAIRCIAELGIEADKTLHEWIYLLERLFAETGCRGLSTEQPRHERPHSDIVIVRVGFNSVGKLHLGSPTQPRGILAAFRQ